MYIVVFLDQLTHQGHATYVMPLHTPVDCILALASLTTSHRFALAGVHPVVPGYSALLDPVAHPPAAFANLQCNGTAGQTACVAAAQHIQRPNQRS